jgi:hypothetical protein
MRTEEMTRQGSKSVLSSIKSYSIVTPSKAGDRESRISRSELQNMISKTPSNLKMKAKSPFEASNATIPEEGKSTYEAMARADRYDKNQLALKKAEAHRSMDNAIEMEVTTFDFNAGKGRRTEKAIRDAIDE